VAQRARALCIFALRRDSRIRDRDGIALRSEEFAEPATHFSCAANDQRSASAAASAGCDANAFLRGQRAAYQQTQHRLRERWRDTERSRSLPRLQQHITLAAEVARRPTCRALHFGDLATERLPLGDQRQQLPVERAQTFA